MQANMFDDLPVTLLFAVCHRSGRRLRCFSDISHGDCATPFFVCFPICSCNCHWQSPRLLCLVSVFVLLFLARASPQSIPLWKDIPALASRSEFVQGRIVESNELTGLHIEDGGILQIDNLVHLTVSNFKRNNHEFKKTTGDSTTTRTVQQLHTQRYSLVRQWHHSETCNLCKQSCRVMCETTITLIFKQDVIIYTTGSMHIYIL